MTTPAPRIVAGRYRLLSTLGRGGMGTVWRAQDEVLGREVALKEITFPHGLSDAERDVLRERTRREARAAARLDHPSAVTVFDVVEDGGAPCLVMELVEAPTLAEVVRTRGPLAPARAAQVGLALLGALEAAHRQGILHRDVKPSNVMVRDDGRVVLTDFGIASSTGDAAITHTGLLLGSPAYIAPERARGEAPGPPSDLWSLGATLFTAVEGRPPFEGDVPLVTVAAVVTGDHAPFALAGPLGPVLDGLLDKDPATRLDAAAARPLLERVAAGPEQRTQVLTRPVPPVAPAPEASRTAALPLEAVQREVRERPAAPVRPVPVRPAPVRPAPARSGRSGWLLPLAALALLAGVGGGAYALAQDDDPGTTAAPSTTAAPTTAPTAAPSAATTSEPEPPAAVTQAPPPAPSPATSPEPTAEVSPPAEEIAPSAAPSAAGAQGVPAGWTTDTAPAGWTVGLPPGWTERRAGEYRDGEGRTLRVETGAGQPDAVADRQAAARSFAQRHPTYRELRIVPVDYRGYEAADWEFTYEGRHVVNRVFVVDGTGHSLFLQVPEGDTGVRGRMDELAAAFTPVGG